MDGSAGLRPLSSDDLVIQNDKMIMSKKQKEKEDEFFGPFKNVTIDDLPSMKKEEIWTLINEQAEGKVDAKVFGQCLHKVAMSAVSMGFVPTGPAGPPLMVPIETAFSGACDVVDILVPGLSPDLFRVIDHNNDGTISEEEWNQGMDMILGSFQSPPGGEQILDLVFLICDKNGNGKLEDEEIMELLKKIVGLVSKVFTSMAKSLEEVASSMRSHTLVEQAFAVLDRDGDGKLSPDECFMGFPPQLLAGVEAAPNIINMAPMAEDAPIPASLVTLGMIYLGLIESIHSYDEVIAKFEPLEAGMQALAISQDNDDALIAKMSANAKRGLNQLSSARAAKAVFEQGGKENYKEFLRTLCVNTWGSILGIITSHPFFNTLNPNKGWAKMLDDTMTLLESNIEDFKNGKYDAELSVFSDAHFDILDADKDGRVTHNDYKFFTTIFFDPCKSKEEAKARLMTWFNRIDEGKSGLITKDELLAFVSTAYAMQFKAGLLGQRMMLDFVSKFVEIVVSELLVFYRKFRQSAAGGSAVVDALDKPELMALLSSAPVWLQAFFVAQTKATADDFFANFPEDLLPPGANPFTSMPMFGGSRGYEGPSGYGGRRRL